MENGGLINKLPVSTNGHRLDHITRSFLIKYPSSENNFNERISENTIENTISFKCNRGSVISLLVCPLDFRYGRETMKQVFDEERRLQMMLDVEASLARAHAKVGNILQEDADIISTKANISAVKLARVKDLEKDTNHDIMAVVKALSEQCGKSGDFIHLGATSNDIVDTLTACQFKQALGIIEDDLVLLENTLADLAEKYKATMMVGRTHGQFAIPLTFGMKMAVYALETHRHVERLREARPRICVGKMSGAVGTGAALGQHAREIQSLVMEDLGLGTEEASLQLVGRDRYVEFVTLMANIASSLEKFSLEIRNLQRSEIREVSEAFDSDKQVGSSTMAHKRNPITSENVCSLARIVRGFVNPAMENVPLWHERDLTNSASERIIIPHVCVLIDDMLTKTSSVFATLVVFPERMQENLASTKGLIMAEAVMISLVKKGVGRQDAHELMRNLSTKALERQSTLMDEILADKQLSKLFSESELNQILDPKNYIGRAEEIVKTAVGKIRSGS
jgi:adenylosuccinate lyase